MNRSRGRYAILLDSRSQLLPSRVRNPQSNLSMGSSKRPCHVYREAIVTSHIRASVSPKRVKILCQCAHSRWKTAVVVVFSFLCSANAQYSMLLYS
ncbi:hypothetical protein L208DRAFT_50778 [Tricholoma matsutake]|nr:hypothetical protein L208DRAFT_50778 [Tricholoma matsutake 945]